jgi:DNA-directed RNA polymerase sigma subunit (sigma70/sigma32)
LRPPRQRPKVLRLFQATTWPVISLDAIRDSRSAIIEMIIEPDGARPCQVDTVEIFANLMGSLQPREQRVLSLRFGLERRERLSLSRGAQMLGVSEERICQIQNSALERLGAAVDEQDSFGRQDERSWEEKRRAGHAS